jgi:hypothetical protein
LNWQPTYGKSWKIKEKSFVVVEIQFEFYLPKTTATIIRVTRFFPRLFPREKKTEKSIVEKLMSKLLNKHGKHIRRGIGVSEEICQQTLGRKYSENKSLAIVCISSRAFSFDTFSLGDKACS